MRFRGDLYICGSGKVEGAEIDICIHSIGLRGVKMFTCKV